MAHADTIALPVRAGRDAVIAARAATVRNVQINAQILPRNGADDRLAIHRLQLERRDIRAFRHGAGNAKRTPAGPAAFGMGAAVVKLVLTADQDIRKRPVGLTPGIEDFRRCGLSQNGRNRAEQGRGDMRIMLRLDFEAGVFLRDPFDRTAHHTQIVDVLRISQHGHGQRTGLRAGGLVRRVEHFRNRGISQQAAVHFGRDRHAMGFECRDGRLDDGDGLGREAAVGGSGHERSP